MAYLTESNLRSYKADASMQRGHRLVESVKSRASTTMFLSHSHHDRELVEGLILLLATEAGVSIYVDWQDQAMPRITSGQTADALKTRIGENEKFVILATKNALMSRWVPWEIGVADVKKSRQDILLIPVADASGVFQGSEYLQLYQHLELEGYSRATKIRGAAGEYTASRLGTWLTR